MLRQHVALKFSCIDYFLSGIETAIGKLQKLFFHPNDNGLFSLTVFVSKNVQSIY